MDAKESLETIEQLKRYFDDEVVQRALDSLDSGAFDSWKISKLLSGRGAKFLWPKIEQRLKQNLSLRNIAVLSEHLPRKEVLSLLDQAAIEDAQVIDEVRNGGFPPVKILSKERCVRLFDALKNAFRVDLGSEHAETILLFLLAFDRKPCEPQFASDDSVKLATDWCLMFGDDRRVEKVLARLLWMRPSEQIIHLAESHLYDGEWTMDTTFLMTGLMEARRTSQPKEWMERWYECSELRPGLDGWVFSEWIRTTNCSRRALAGGIEAIRFGCSDSLFIMRGMIDFLHRKSVNRWLYRFVRSNINRQSVKMIVPELVQKSPTKHHRALAKLAMKWADDEDACNILMALIEHTNDADVVELAKKRAYEFPNAPNSLELMCAVATSDRDTAVPWIKEWIETALVDQVGDGLTAIVAVSPTQEHLKMAREWYTKVEQEELPVSTWRRARLLNALLVVDWQEETSQKAVELLRRAPNKRHPVLDRLSRRLKSGPV